MELVVKAMAEATQRRFQRDVTRELSRENVL